MVLSGSGKVVSRSESRGLGVYLGVGSNSVLHRGLARVKLSGCARKIDGDVASSRGIATKSPLL